MIDFLLEKNLLPDPVIRFGIRRLLAQRLREEAQPSEAARLAKVAAYAADLRTRPIAEDTRAANEQHYEVPTPFYQYCLGKRLKYSGCLCAARFCPAGRCGSQGDRPVVDPQLQGEPLGRPRAQ